MSAIDLIIEGVQIIGTGCCIGIMMIFYYYLQECWLLSKRKKIDKESWGKTRYDDLLDGEIDDV